MEKDEDGTGKPQCCSGQGMGSAGNRPGYPGPELVLLDSHFTGLVVGQLNVELCTFRTCHCTPQAVLSPQPGPSTVPGVPTPHCLPC